MTRLYLKSVEWICFLSFCVCLHNCQSVFGLGNDEIISQGATSSRLGGASLTLIDAWASMNNQGALAFLDHPIVGLSYESRYNLKELSVRSLAVAYPFKSGVLSTQLSSFGGELFAVYKFGGGYSRKFGEHVGLGLHFDGLSIKMNPNIRTKYVATFELGFLFILSERSKVGFHLFNPAAVSFNLETYNEKIPVEYRIGGSYQMSGKFDVLYELAGSNENAPFGRVGFNYQLANAVQLSIGFQTLGASLGAGVEYTFSNIRMNFGCRSTQRIGRIYSISASYYFK